MLKSSFPVLRELNEIFYLELAEMNSQIIKTIKWNVFHFERILEVLVLTKKKKKNYWHLYVLLISPSYYCLHLIHGPALDSII